MTSSTVFQDFLIRTRALRDRPFAAYVVSCGLAGVALVVRIIPGWTFDGPPFFTFFLAVIAATVLGGRGPGALSVLIGAATGWSFVVPQQSTFAGYSQADLIQLSVFVGIAFCVCVLIDWLVKTAEENAVLAKRTEALFVELQHRVKNHIQIVASLLNLQARRSEPAVAVALTDAARRINTISAAYAHLYQSDLKLDFAQHLHDIADAALGGARGQRTIDVKAEPLYWNMDLVMPVSLIVSEMIDNALRHGLTDGKGRIDVLLGRHGEHYRLVVSDDGNKLPSDFNVATSNGLGLQLIAAMARRIDATVRAETVRTDRGAMTAFTVEFPAPVAEST